MVIFVIKIYFTVKELFCIASHHCEYNESLSEDFILGSKTFFDLMMDFISSLEFHVPIFNPAIKTTPRAVVSVVLATLIVLSKISA